MAIRKTPAQQIERARATLARALQRQRNQDTHSKILIGELAISWLRNSPQAAAQFVSGLDKFAMSDRDRTAISWFIAELNERAQQHMTNQNKPFKF